MVTACIVTIVAVARRPDAGTTDFRTFYQSGRLYLAGADPYIPFDPNRGPNLNPPWVVAVMAPLCRMPIALAAGCWWALSFVCFGAAIALIARAVAPGRVLDIASIVLVTQAAYVNIRLGQVAWPLMLLVTCAWLADRTDRSTLCGFLIGVAASWKPFLLAFVPYLLWRRQWRSLAAMTGAVVVTSAAGLLAVGSAGYASWFSVLGQVSWSGHLLNASLRALFTRVLAPATLVEQPTTPLIDAPALLDPLWLIAVAIVIATTVWQVAKRDTDLAWAAILLAALLISPLGWLHYVPIAAGPLAAVFMSGRPGGVRAAALGWLLLCVPFAALKAQRFGPVLTATVASSYVWAVGFLFIGVYLSGPLRGPREQFSVLVGSPTDHDGAR